MDAEQLFKFRSYIPIKSKYKQIPIYSDSKTQYYNLPNTKVKPFKFQSIKNGGIVKNQEGGLAELAPIYGTYKAGQRFFKNPTWGNAGELALSGLGDLALFSGIGTGIGMAAKAAKAAKAVKTAKGISKFKNAEKAKRYYDLSGQAAQDGAILYGGSTAIKAQNK